jgi:uncharacterized protein YciI
MKYGCPFTVNVLFVPEPSSLTTEAAFGEAYTLNAEIARKAVNIIFIAKRFATLPQVYDIRETPRMLFALAASVCVSSSHQNDARPAFMILLVRPDQPTNYATEELNRIQAGHLAHLTKMYNDGYAKVAGPFMKDNRIRGIVVMRAENLQQAKSMCEQDPAVKANRLAVEAYAWNQSRWSRRLSWL